MFLPGVGAIVLSLLFLGGSLFFGNINSKGTLEMMPQTEINQTIAETPEVVVPQDPIDFSAMKQAVEEIIGDYNDADFGIFFKDLVSNKSWGVNEDKVFTAASTMKVLAVSGLYDAVERGKLDLETRVGGAALREHARLALEVSDNNSWETINNTVGYQNLQNYAEGLGLDNVNVFDNSITATDFALLLEKLYRGQLLTGEDTEEVLSFMDHTETENRIPAGIDGAEIIYHKTGTLDFLTHDGAIVRSGDGDYILTIYTEFLPGNVDTRSEALAKVSKTVWEEYRRKLKV